MTFFFLLLFFINTFSPNSGHEIKSDFIFSQLAIAATKPNFDAKRWVSHLSKNYLDYIDDNFVEDLSFEGCGYVEGSFERNNFFLLESLIGNLLDHKEARCKIRKVINKRSLKKFSYKEKHNLAVRLLAGSDSLEVREMMLALRIDSFHSNDVGYKQASLQLARELYKNSDRGKSKYSHRSDLRINVCQRLY